MVSEIPERIAKQYSAIVFKVDEDGTHHVAMADPDDVQAVDFIQKYTGKNLVLYVATQENILICLQAYREGVESEIDKVIEIEKDTSADQKSI